MASNEYRRGVAPSTLIQEPAPQQQSTGNMVAVNLDIRSYRVFTLGEIVAGLKIGLDGEVRASSCLDVFCDSLVIICHLLFVVVVLLCWSSVNDDLYLTLAEDSHAGIPR